MSQPVPPPSGNPFAGAGADAQYAPAPPPAPVRDNVVLGIVVAVVAALVGAGAYGALGGAIEREVGYAAIGVGFLIGFAAAKIGGRNPVLPFVSALLSLPAVYLGQLVAIAVILGKTTDTAFADIFLDNFGTLTDAWSEAADGMTYVFLAISAAAAFAGAKKANA
ncbi:hypothetical protein HRW23_04680 [Streptomyces lunaelactis]|uniref:hypothetical protein n=1 Tax=Streptomyces lunaelactis TaxID=1535768 RepID=UPI00158498BD|nr:hypothetical protein [Streptomyces lunaelactis]NUK08539.1 hypothetical protein [Streptomyces lunaelactis]NUK32633.1 hypothetical protein [Streptomyces lunaelactis]NUK41582.1 hypothetical protein [Streptomyces lunaelactis]NUK70205.1 hypothetical protein [Streptomyces lunaelactis]NUK76713.1 hypothetical protein [Streptomyces lunaelactis]